MNVAVCIRQHRILTSAFMSLHFLPSDTLTLQKVNQELSHKSQLTFGYELLILEVEKHFVLPLWRRWQYLSRNVSGPLLVWIAVRNTATSLLYHILNGSSGNWPSPYGHTKCVRRPMAAFWHIHVFYRVVLQRRFHWAVYLRLFAKRDLIGWWIHRCLKSLTFLNFLTQAREPTERTEPQCISRDTPWKVNGIRWRTHVVWM